jgi:hypothetical protein
MGQKKIRSKKLHKLSAKRERKVSRKLTESGLLRKRTNAAGGQMSGDGLDERAVMENLKKVMNLGFTRRLMRK